MDEDQVEELHILWKGLEMVLLGIVIRILSVSFIIGRIEVNEMRHEQAELNANVEKILKEFTLE